jgi:hypothetical protein
MLLILRVEQVLPNFIVGNEIFGKRRRKEY